MLFLYNYKARINLIRHEGKFINIIKKTKIVFPTLLLSDLIIITIVYLFFKKKKKKYVSHFICLLMTNTMRNVLGKFR